MTHQRHDDRRDENEPMIVAALRKRGDTVIRLGRGVGADLLVINPRGPHIVEIKDPTKKWRFTDSEKRLRAACAKHGVKYHMLMWTHDIYGIPFMPLSR
jgi:hypothetical protein